MTLHLLPLFAVAASIISFSSQYFSPVASPRSPSFVRAGVMLLLVGLAIVHLRRAPEAAQI